MDGGWGSAADRCREAATDGRVGGCLSWGGGAAPEAGREFNFKWVKDAASEVVTGC